MDQTNNLLPTTHCNVEEDYNSDTTEELIIVPVDPLDIGSPISPSDQDIIINESASSPPNLVNGPEKRGEDILRSESPQMPRITSTAVRTNSSCENCKLKTFAAQTAARSQQIREEIVAIKELQTNTIAYSLLNAPREHLRTFLKNKIGFPRPKGAQNFLNIIFSDGKTLLHGSVLQKRYDITDLLLAYGANVDIREENRTVLHRATERNDTLLCSIAISYGADLSAYNEIGETPLLTAVAFSNQEVLLSLWRQVKHHIPSTNNENLFHYAARYNNVKIAKLACDPRHKIDVHMVSKHEQRTALHIAVIDNRAEIVEILLNHGARDDQVDNLGHFAYEYIRTDNVEKIFLKYKMRIIPATNPIEKRKPQLTATDSEPIPKQMRFTLTTTTTPVTAELLRADFNQTAQQPLRQEIEKFALYNPEDKTNSFLHLEATGFAKEILIFEAMPVERPIPTNYKKPDLQNRAPVMQYVINNPRQYQLHVTLLNNAYTRRVMYCNRAWYKRDLYEIYRWERDNITRSLQEYRVKIMKTIQDQAARASAQITALDLSYKK